MKKFAFAVQVVGLIILIPVWVILEVNHRLPGNKQHSVVENKVDKTSIQLSLNAESKNDNVIAY